jgi:hypothetical protein
VTNTIGYLASCPPGYNCGKEYLTQKAFQDAQNEFAAQIHEQAFPKLRQWSATLWSNFPHAFHGIECVLSKVNRSETRDSLPW